MDKKFVDAIVKTAKKEGEDVTLYTTQAVALSLVKDEDADLIGELGNTNVLALDADTIEVGSSSLSFSYEKRNRVHTEVVAFAHIIRMVGSFKTAKGKELAEATSARMKKGKADKDKKKSKKSKK